jgi:uncharacterized membrane protein YbhN (UPF0104 family)
MELTPAKLVSLRGVRFFSSAVDAGRRRRPTDVLLLLVAAAVIAALSANAPGPTSVDSSLNSLLDDVDPVLGWFWPLVYALLLVWVLVVALAPVAGLRRGRLPLLWDYVLALAVAVALGILVSVLGGTPIDQSVATLAGTDTGAVYVPLRISVATAIVVTASPHVTRPFRVVGRLLLVLGAVATVALGLAHTSGAVAGAAVGLAAAATVHLLRGSPGGLLTPPQVSEALLDLGIVASAARPMPASAPGEQNFAIETADGTDLVVTVMGRDAWDAQLVGSLWDALTKRGESPRLSMTRRERVEREAMVGLLAERAGVPLLPVVAAGQGVRGEAMLVTAAAQQTLAEVPADTLTDQTVAEVWAALAPLHSQGIAHRTITAEHIVATEDGRWGWSNLGRARLAASTTDLMLDRAHLLAMTWLLVGSQRAVDAAAAALGPGELEKTLPYLQEPGLTPALRRAMGTDHVLDELRARAVAVTDAQDVPTVRLRRVTGASVAKLLVTLVIVSTLVSLLAGVDISEIVDELRQADWALLLLALLVAPLAQVGFSFSTVGASTRALPYVPVLVLQYAIQFLALVFPSTGARAALQIRFFERVGVPYGAAIPMGMIDGISGFVVQVSLLLIIALSSLPGVTTTVAPASGSSDGSSSSPSILGLALLIALLWGVTTLAVPRRRARARRAIPRFTEALKGQAGVARGALTVVKQPAKVSMMLGGNLAAQVIQAIVLGICLSAFGESVSLSQLILVNTFVSLFAGIMPVPGGVGVAEAGFAYGLQAVGIPSAVAVSTAIAFRLVTFYLPPLWGSLAMRWLRKGAYV